MRRSSKTESDISGLIIEIDSLVQFWRQTTQAKRFTMPAPLLSELQIVLNKMHSALERSGSTSI